MSIKAIDKASIHHITSGQVVVDLQTAVKELIENSLDGGATNIEVRFKNHGLSAIEVIDNGCGISEEDHESIGLKHHTSKLETYSDLTSVRTFGFRGEALSSLCALCEQVTICTATATTAPMGACLILDNNGKLKKKSAVARNQGTTITLTNIFSSLAVRRKELERNIKREYGKTLSLLNAYALGPCANPPGIRFTVSNQPDKGPKTVQIRTLGSPSCRDSITAIWGPKALDNIIDIDLTFEVEREKIAIKRLQGQQLGDFSVQVKGLVSKFAVGCGRTGTDRQFFYVNGRPCNMNKVQKTFNEVYRSFNAMQSPFIVADFILPTETYDVNVSPDKRTILLHSEGNLISALKLALETHFAPTRATYDLEGQTQTQSKALTQTLLSQSVKPVAKAKSTAVAFRREGVASSDTSQPIPVDGESESETLAPAHGLGPPRPSSDDIEIDRNDVPSEQGDVHRAAAEDHMDVDVENENENENDFTPPNVVLDTSQTSWGRRLSSSQSQSQSPSSPSRLCAVVVEEEEDAPNPDDDDISTTAHPRKKRKSDSGLALIDTPPSPSPSPTDVLVLNAQLLSAGGKRASSSSSSSSRIIQIGEPSGQGATVLKLKVDKVPKVSQNKSQVLRSRLAGFARSGSRVAESEKDGKAVVDVDEEEEDELEEEGQDDVEVVEEHAEEQHGATEDERDRKEVLGHLTLGNFTQSTNEGAGDVSSPIRPNREIHSIDEDEDNSQDPNILLDEVRRSIAESSPPTSQPKATPRIEVVKGEQSVGDVCLRFDSDRIKNAWAQRTSSQRIMSLREGDVEQAVVSIPSDANVSNTDDEEGAINALARIIEKKDFETMTIVGQFNLGFIVVRRRNHQRRMQDDESEAPSAQELDDLFIVDQHAADEKYNFETLQATTKIEAQKLFRPRPLELTASDELVAIENMDILQQNGFEVEIDSEASIGQGSRLKLTAQPVSKSTVFDMKDLEEVINLLRDRPGGQMVRCSKARAMFAMRACRKSVMIGMPLKLHQMTTVIRHMGTMDQPWNCPHGRPTMRHLLDIRSRGSTPKTDVDWSSFE